MPEGMTRYPRKGLTQEEVLKSISRGLDTILLEFSCLAFSPLDTEDGKYAGNSKGWLPSTLIAPPT